MTASECPPELPRQPLLEHLAELKKRLLISLGTFFAASIAGYYFAPAMYAFLAQPLANILAASPNHKFIYTSLTEPFVAHLKLAVFAGFLLSFPIIAAQIYLFLAPGLYKKERGALVPYLVAAPTLFICGAAFVYYFIFPAAWHFFLGFESSATSGELAIQLEPRVGEYLMLVMHMIIAFGLSFQLPVVLVLLVRCGLMEVAALKRGRRYALVLIVTVAAFITPPDIFSQIALSVPLYVVYELSIFLCRNTKKIEVEDA